MRAGERARAFRLLRDRYARKIYSNAMRAVRDHHLAEDVMQESLFQIFKDLDAVRDASSLRSWVFTVTTHRAIDAIRRRAREQGRIVNLEESPEAFDPGQLPPELTAFADDVRELNVCMAELPPKTQQAVLMRYQRGMSFEDMAKGLDEKSDAVRMRVVRALKRLRACLEKKGRAS